METHKKGRTLFWERPCAYICSVLHRVKSSQVNRPKREKKTEGTLYRGGKRRKKDEGNRSRAGNGFPHHPNSIRKGDFFEKGEIECYLGFNVL